MTPSCPWTAHGAWAARAHADKPLDAPSVLPDNDLFATRDGRWLALGILENKFWLALGEALGAAHPALHDPRFATRAGRMRYKEEVHAMLRASSWAARWRNGRRPLPGGTCRSRPCSSTSAVRRPPCAGARHDPLAAGGEGIALRFPVKFSLGLPDSGMEVPRWVEPDAGWRLGGGGDGGERVRRQGAIWV